MGQNHIQEFKRNKTINGYTEHDAKTHVDPYIRLLHKDVIGKTSTEEKISIEINSLLLYNNIDYISDNEIQETVKKIMKLTKNNGNGIK